MVTIRAHDGSIGTLRRGTPTNGEDDLRALAELSKAHACVRGVELLPYHRFGEYKFERMGFAYKLAGMNTPSAAEIDEATAFLTSLGVDVIC